MRARARRRPSATDPSERRRRASPAPEVRVVMGNEAARTVVHPRGLRPASRSSSSRSNSGSWHSREVADLGGPVVHLGVDVDRVLAAPGGVQVVVPEALEVRRLAARPRAGDQQVAAKLEVGAASPGSAVPARRAARRTSVGRAFRSAEPRSRRTRRNRERWSARWRSSNSP